MKTIIYTRVSTDDQATSGLGLEAQLRACRRVAERFPEATETLHFEDAGLSGALPIDKRPGLTAALTALGRGDVLIVAKRDRIARDQLITLTVEQLVRRSKARLISAAGEGTESTDEMQRIVLSSMSDMFAQLERMMISRRTRDAMRAKQERGEHTGIPPYGFRKEGKLLVPDPDEQQVLKKILSLRKKDYSTREITERLNKDAIPNRSGKWHQTQVQRIIKRMENKA